MSARDIFGARDVYTSYQVAVQVRDVLVGGVPSDPGVIRKWLESRLEVGDEKLREIARQTIMERGLPDEPMSIGQQMDLIMESEAAPSVSGFKRMPGGELAYEGRCLKGAIKEWANSAYPGTTYDGKKQASDKGFAAPRKGLLSTIAERVFVDPRLIGLHVSEPSRIEERIKHVKTPQGPVSAISRVEVVDEPLVEFTVRVRDDFLPPEAWSRIWQTGEEIGIGADRARSDGRFDLVKWEKIS